MSEPELVSDLAIAHLVLKRPHTMHTVTVDVTRLRRAGDVLTVHGRAGEVTITATLPPPVLATLLRELADAVEDSAR